MKNILFFALFLLLGGVSLPAQQVESVAPASASASDAKDQELRKITEALTAKYSLNADQAKQVYTIQVRKAKNMAQIAEFKDSDPALYRSKSLNIQKNTLANIRAILNTQAQVELYQKTQSETRLMRNKKQKELSANRASKADIETAILAIYAE